MDELKPGTDADADDSAGSDLGAIHKRALADFKRCAEAEETNRANALEDLEFAKLGKQWPEAIRKQRELEGRPCLTFNKMPAFIRQVVNDSRLNRPSIQVHPVDSDSDPKTAEIYSGLIRNIEVTSNADVAYDTSVDQAVSGGFGYFRVNIDYACDDTFDLDIKIERIANQFTVYGDPDSTAADSSDWNIAFVTELLSRDEFEERYPDAAPTNVDGGDERDENWYLEDQVRIAEYWVREEVQKALTLLSDGTVLDEDSLAEVQPLIDQGLLQVVDTRTARGYQITQYIINGAEVLETNEWVGVYIPIVLVCGDEVIVEGKRYFRSLLADAKDAQRTYNYWRTSSVEKVALDTKAPWIGPVGAFDTDIAKWQTANAKNHAFIEYDAIPNMPPPQRSYSSGVPAGDLALAANAADDMKSIMGIYDASLGARSNETSGVAIQARQKEGDVSTFHFIDNLSRAIRHTGRIIVDLIPKVYNTERIIRVLGQDRKPAEMLPGQPPGMVPINQPVPQQDGTIKVFSLTAGKYDVTVETGPSFSTKRQESAAQMIDMVRGNPQLMPIIGDLLASNLDWPGADEIAKRLKLMMPPQLQGQNPQAAQAQQQMKQMDQAHQQQFAQLQQQMQAMQGALQAAQVENQQLKQAVNDKTTENQIKAEEVRVKGYDAETKRFQAMKPPPMTTPAALPAETQADF